MREEDLVEEEAEVRKPMALGRGAGEEARRWTHTQQVGIDAVAWGRGRGKTKKALGFPSPPVGGPTRADGNAGEDRNPSSGLGVKALRRHAWGTARR